MTTVTELWREAYEAWYRQKWWEAVIFQAETSDE